VTPRRIVVVLVVAVAAAIGVSRWMAGSASASRQLALDERRMQHLAAIQEWVNRYWDSRKALPPSLGVISRDPIGAMLPTDPETGAQYEYRPTGERTFELCATFSRGRTAADLGSGPNPGPPHPAGRHCLEREVRDRGR
jgi:type II secretory pathway pseudopilin PulG